jgi:hypothetical protein
MKRRKVYKLKYMTLPRKITYKIELLGTSMPCQSIMIALQCARIRFRCLVLVLSEAVLVLVLVCVAIAG